MRICAISDLHGVLPKIEPSELCIIAGDVSPLDRQRDDTPMIAWLFGTFLNWIKEMPCDHVFMVAGNHDFVASDNYCVMKALEYLSDWKLSYLQNESELYLAPDGRNIWVYGTPYCHKFGNWAFMEHEFDLEKLYEAIPENTDILITHDTPAIGDLDLLQSSKWSAHAGGKALATAIERIKPRYVFCGHLHTCKDKYMKINNTEIYNVSILDNEYVNVYKPTYVEYD